MKKQFAFITLALLLVLGTAIPALAQEPSGDFAVVQQAADAYLSAGKSPNISAPDLFEILNDGDPSNDPFILSVRSAEQYAKGHIPGAVNVPWREVAKAENLAKLPTDKQIVVYCYTGHTASQVTAILSSLGYDAINMKFGMTGWTTDPDVAPPGHFTNERDSNDFRVEVSEVPVTLPTTGGAPLPDAALLGLMISGIASLMAGVTGYVWRRRKSA